MQDNLQDLASVRHWIKSYCVTAVDAVNEALSGLTPTEIIILTIVTLISYFFVIDTLKEWWKIGPKILVFRFMTKTFLRTKIQQENDKLYKSVYEKYL